MDEPTPKPNNNNRPKVDENAGSRPPVRGRRNKNPTNPASAASPKGGGQKPKPQNNPKRSQSHNPSTQRTFQDLRQHLNNKRNGKVQKHDENGQLPRGTPTPQGLGGSSAGQKQGTPNNNKRHAFRTSGKPEPGLQRSNRHVKTSSFEAPPAKKPRDFLVGFKYLEQLMAMNDEEFATRLTSHHAGLSDLMRTELSRDMMVLAVRVIRRAANSVLDHSRVIILQAGLVDGFIENLEKYIGLLPLQSQQQKNKNRYFWSNPDGFWSDLLEICTVILDIMPTLAANVLPRILTVMKVYMPSIELQHKLLIPDGIKSKMEDLSKAVADCTQKLKEERKLVLEEDLPPNDFRTIDVLPSSSEVLGDRNFLRKNILEGGYASVDHYLDVQFRLLREDFVRPLRKGIQSYRADPKKRLENVRVYKKVRFLNAETENNNYCMRIKFEWNNLKKLKSVNFENWKRFMFGSLLCFTKDNFKTIFFGRVVGRKSEDLERGELIVGFDDSLEMLSDTQTDFVMVECSVYFEPYYHVLKAMQTVQQDEFPMDKYIVFVNPVVDKPRYVEDATRYAVGRAKLPVLANWSAEELAQAHLRLNDNQLEAYKSALAQEFVIIQGPPGTGKTYLGLRIAKTLIRNRDVWHKNNAPMLVICYTNHALDQFLEGMVPFTGGNMARIGGQSNNETLKPYNLRMLRKFDVASNDMRHTLRNLLVQIKEASGLLQKLQDWKCLMTFHVFQESNLIPNPSFFTKALPGQLLEWFFYEVDRKGESFMEPLRNLDRMKAVDEKIRKEGAIDSDVDEENDDGLFQSVLDNLDIPTSSVLINQEMIEKEINRLQLELDCFLNTDADEMQKLLKNATITESIRLWRNRSFYLQAKLQDLMRKDSLPARMGQPDDVDWKNPRPMRYANRWDLYLHLVQSVRPLLTRKLEYLNRHFRRLYAAYEEIQNVADVRVMRSKLVIGMTTTGAARQRKYLELLKCPVVIVEEAAEVLEAHIVASITAHCQHLILIGDHQQLQPSTADYNVKVNYGLGISLFERMVKNDFHCHTLNVQHRMRPEFSTLIRGSIYDNLQDHESVFNRPQVPGIDRCLYFVDHQQEEQSLEGTSKKNVHEAEFLVALAKYLVLNGHAAQKITILAAYLGQMFEINNKMKWHGDLLKECRVSALDNYQGEENDLVLLSLVRSNAENKIGFLAEDNRVCVALSRAKNGFYIIGNMTQLCHESHRGHGLWSKIKTKFEEQNSIGSSLTLRCQIHDAVTQVKSADDFLQVPEGGCTKKCEVTLKCGHDCQSICHMWDREHKEHPCRQICMKNLCDKDDTHLCKSLCNEPCGPCTYLVPAKLECGHERELECHVDKNTFQCPVLVTTKLPCDHTAEKPCHRDPVTFRCPHQCDAIVEPCGHACQLKCHIRKDPDHLEYKCPKKCAKHLKGCTVKTKKHLCPRLCYEECLPCDMPVNKKRTVCPHAFEVPCNENVDDLVCPKPCTKILDCGHKCRNKCSESCGPCRVKVNKKIELCGHTQQVECHAAPDRNKCRSKCPLELPCGHPCTAKCNEPCSDKCKKKVTLTSGILAACGHIVNQVECHQSQKSLAADDPDLLEQCTEPCGVVLKCKHECTGNCSDCFQGRFHQRCSSKCGVPLVCNHLCKNPCREACRSCTEPCPNKCEHSSCKRRCGEVCTPCKEKCPRRCPHRRCRKFCGEPCEVSPCEEPCEERLKCGHECAGFCGDPCPSKCKVCDPEILVVHLGYEDEPEARFVQLQDCPHVVEESGMIQWLKTASEQIAFKVCPVCSTPIKTTHRYSNYVKNAALDVIKVKTKLAGIPKENAAEAKILIEKVKLAKARAKYFAIEEALEVLRVRLEPVRGEKRQAIDKVQLNAVTSKLQLIERLMKATGDFPEPKHAKRIRAIVDVITVRDEDYITDQEIDDVSREIDRLSKLIPFSRIDRSETSKMTAKIEEMLKRGEALAYAPKVYTPEEDEEFEKILNELKSVFPIDLISMAEKQAIAGAMGFARGHWYRCPNGHLYNIGDCGGAVQTSKCSECGATIGGTGYRLAADNSTATDMENF